MKSKNRRVPIEKIVLGTVAAAGALAVVAVLPGIAPAFALFDTGKRKPHKKYVDNVLSRMNQKGYISFEYISGKKVIRLTKKGESKLYEYKKSRGLQIIPKKWDGKWRIVIFDINEGRKSTRNKLRYELIQAGFVLLQRSVWMYPFDCEEYIAMLKADNKIGKDVLYIVADKVEYDKKYRELFDVSKYRSGKDKILDFLYT